MTVCFGPAASFTGRVWGPEEQSAWLFIGGEGSEEGKHRKVARSSYNLPFPAPAEAECGEEVPIGHVIPNHPYQAGRGLADLLPTLSLDGPSTLA